jgi:hypothetical protein
MAILAADSDTGPLGARGESRDQEKRRADQDINTGGKAGSAGNNLVEFQHGPGEAIHLPIAGDEGTTRHSVLDRVQAGNCQKVL